MLELFILFFTVLINLILGFTVFLKNPRGITNRLFLFLAVTFVIWSAVNYISVHPILFSQLFWVRLVLFCGAILNLAVFLTFLAFPDYSLHSHYRRRVKYAILATLVIAPLTLTPAVFGGIEIVNGVSNPTPNPGIGLYLLQTLILLGSSFFILVRKYLRANGEDRKQLKLVLWAIIGTFSLIITTNFLLVILFDITIFVPLGSAFTLIFSSTMAYAIVRHKLFDIRLIIARALGYALSLGTFIGLYALTLFVIAQKAFNDYSSVLVDRLIPLVAALILGLSYPRFKRFFDRLTNRVFYRDAYDAQAFLDELNSTIVGNIELGILLRHTTSVIQKNLKSAHCFMDVLETPTVESRVMGVGTLQLTKDESELIFDSLRKLNQKTLVADQLGSSDDKLRNLLSEKNIGLITKLVPGQSGSSKAIAYLIIGQKKSGNVYDKKDIRIVDIISDELLIAIQNALRFEEIQEFNITLQAKVNEATAKLQRTNKKLRDLDETKDEFISMASHQLRTPLTTVKGYMSMVLEGDAGKLTKQQAELLEQAFISSQRMVYLIADLLNVSRLKSGKFLIDSQPTNLVEVVSGEVKQLKETANAKGLSFEFKKPKKFPELMLDETKIRQVIMNFSDNAIYYTPSGGTITIELKEDRGSVYFTVKDTGLGVPKEEKNHLFTKFYRAKNARNARPDGTGLGLFMAKKVVDALGGNIIFESEEGKGSTFGFTFEKHKLRVSKPSN